MYLTAVELTEKYYRKAANMDQLDIDTYLFRANSFAQGVIGGPLPSQNIDEALKSAVAMAFEILAKDETGAQIDDVSGNITQAAPEGYFTRRVFKGDDPLKTVKEMLLPYAAIYERLQSPISDRGVQFF